MTALILFLILRLIQGVFVGGVVASTHTIATETIPARWRGTVSGFIGGGGAGIGALIASVIYYITSSVFPGAAFAIWGWRFMFFAGILSSVLGLFIFNALEESPLGQSWLLIPALAASSRHRNAKRRAWSSRSERATISLSAICSNSH